MNVECYELPRYPRKVWVDEKIKLKRQFELRKSIGVAHKKAVDACLEEMRKNGELD